jgi:hypothetical protein
MSDVIAGAARGRADRSSAGWLLLLAVVSGTGLLAAGAWVDGTEAWMVAVAIVPALLWAAAHRRRPALAADALLAAFVVLAGVGLWSGISAGWMVTSVAAGLAAWDLAHFEHRLVLAGNVEGRDRLERRHLIHLVPTVAVGLVLALVAAHGRLNLGFFPILLLSTLAIAGLARAVLYLRRDDD